MSHRPSDLNVTVSEIMRKVALENEQLPASYGSIDLKCWRVETGNGTEGLYLAYAQRQKRPHRYLGLLMMDRDDAPIQPHQKALRPTQLAEAEAIDFDTLVRSLVRLRDKYRD